MLWPLVLPLQLTFCLMAAGVVILTLVSPVFKLRRSKTFVATCLFAGVFFIPSCTGLMRILDAKRFGVFEYDNYAQVRDMRVERYMPIPATEITVEKSMMGHRAKYSITQVELASYLGSLWRTAGKNSTFSRDAFTDGTPLPYDEIAFRFDGLNWPALGTVLEYHSPMQEDGGGATYYFDPDRNTVYHFAGYW